MTQTVPVKWAAAINGDWTLGADWTPSGVPNNTAAFDFFVYIGGAYTVGAAAFTVTSSANETIGFLEIGANATFAINGGLFKIDSFLHPYSNLFNFGKVSVAPGATLSFGDTGAVSKSSGLWNSGSVAVAGTMLLNAPVFVLHDAGVLALSGKIVGATSAGQLFVNKASNIRGFGAIGQNANLIFYNAQGGVVDANSAASLTIDTGANTVTNAGTIRTDGAGGLNLLSNMQHNGQLMAMGTGALRLTGAYVHGGGALTVGAGGSTILKFGEISLGGVVSIASGGTLTTTAGDLGAIGSSNTYVGDVLSAGDIEDNGRIIVVDHSFLNLNATVYGAGEIDLNASTGSTALEIFANGATLFQSGGVVMSDNVLNKIVGNGAAVQISNSTGISGAGTIGDGWLRVVNTVLGSIVANGASKLTIVGDTNNVAAGGKENFNGGSISSTGAGGLLFSGGTLSNSGYLTENGTGVMSMSHFAIDAGGGVVQVLSGRLSLSGNSSISNQARVTLAASTILNTNAGDTADALLGGVTNAGQINVAAQSTLIASGHWVNNKQIVVGTSTTGGTLALQAGARLQFLGVGGTLQLNNVGARIVSAGAGTTLENKTNTILGAGAIGDANMSVSNEVGGVIDATLTGGLSLNSQAEAGGQTFLYNAGTIKADTAAGVTINAGMFSPGKLIADAGSRIVATSNVYGLGTATINGAASIEFGAIAQNDVYFGAVNGGNLILDHSTQFTGDIFGLKAGDSIDLRDFAFVPGLTGIDITQSSFGDAAASLVLVNGTSSSATIHLEGAYVRTSFQVVADGAPSGGTLLKL